jgi:hypothetical protein
MARERDRSRASPQADLHLVPRPAMAEPARSTLERTGQLRSSALLRDAVMRWVWEVIPISVRSPGGGRQIAFSGIWFDDVLVRTESGWKICERRE